MKLRGYDEYEVTLGDEMRGERASLGKTLEDAERDLRIRASVLRAVEDCDLDGFPNDSVVAGYVRSYARYLCMDAEDCYRRFCAESGFRSPVSALGGNAAGNGAGNRAGGLTKGVAAVAAAGAGLTQSRFAMPPAPARLGARVNLGGLTSVLALVALIAGLAYGGNMLLKDIQRVGFAPLPEAPSVVAEAPVMGLPHSDAGLLRRPDSAAYQGDGALAAVTPADLSPPALPARDGPISAVDPATTGVFAEPARAAELASAAMSGPMSGTATGATSGAAPGAASAPAGSPVGTPGALPANANGASPAAVAAATQHQAAMVTANAAAPAAPTSVVVHATDTAWIRVRDASQAVLFEGTLGPGQSFTVPQRTTGPVLRAGNAGAVYLVVGGHTYGPLGGSGQVVSNQSLAATDITSKLPLAKTAALGLAPASENGMQRADATVTQ